MWFLRKFYQFSSPIYPLKMTLHKKWKVWIVELIFHSLSKNVIVPDKASWKNPALASVQKVKLNILKKILFLPLVPGKKCVSILIVPTIESYLQTVQKHEYLAYSTYPNNEYCGHKHDLSIFYFWGRFLTYLMRSSVDTLENEHKTTCTKNSTPLWHLVKIWGYLHIGCVLRVLLHLWGIKNSLFEIASRLPFFAVMG